MVRSPVKLSPAKIKLLSVLSGFFLLVFIELGLRLTIAPSRLESILAILRRDPELIWTQKPGLRAAFFGTEVVTDRLGLRNARRGRKKAFRIVTLGASPTFGWGVSGGEAYAAVLGERLGAVFGERVEVLNGGVVGYSSRQGLGFLRRNWDVLSPDLITVAYVINDVDSYRFYRSDGRADKELAPEGGAWVAAANLLDRLALFRVMLRAAGALGRGRGGVPDHAVYPGEVRVSIDDYGKNLRELAALARSRGAAIVFIKMPVNIPRGMPAVSKPAGEKAYRSGLERFKAGDCARAAPRFTQAVRFDSNISRAHYYLGVCARRAGRPQAARTYFEATRKAESHRCGRDAVRYNEVLERVAKSEGAPLVDIVAAFDRHKEEYLFVNRKKDTIHPNAAGHAIIAAELFSVVKPLAAAKLSR